MSGDHGRRHLVVALRFFLLVGAGCQAQHAGLLTGSEAAPSPTHEDPGAAITGSPLRILEQGSKGLPEEGLVIGRGGDLLFLTAEGDTLASLGNIRLYYEWTVPGPVVVRRGGTFYQLNVDRGVLEPLASRDAASDLSPQFQSDIDLPMPPHDDAIDMAGRWAFVLPDANGTSTLAQWSGECEVPHAMFVDADGVAPAAAVTGEATLADAPASTALGWDDAGRALVYVRRGACSPALSRPGIYAFNGPGIGEPIFVTGRIEAVRMWGSEP